MSADEPEMIEISVIVVTWNGKNVASQCLESLQDYAKDQTVEVIVVDNASTDGTPEMIRERYPFVHLLQNQENLGFAKANNIGLAHCNGNFVCLVNSDVVVPNGCIEQAVAYMRQQPTIGMLGPKMYLPNGSIGQSCMGFPTVWNWFCRALALDNLSVGRQIFGGFLRTDFTYEKTADVEVLTGWFWIVRREALSQVGNLDERYFMYGEDIDWCKRFYDAGWRIVFYPEVHAVHYCGASSANAPTRFYIEMHRANMQYLSKYHGPVAQLGFWASALLHELVRIVGFASLYLTKKSMRNEAGYKVKRSLVCLRWLLGLTPVERTPAR